LVLAAGRRSLPASDQALAALCSAYWYPLYAYARRRLGDVHVAQDLAQEFFARLLEKNILASAQQERGRFRGFLLTAFKNFLANEGDKARAQKRGGGKPPLPLDFHAGDYFIAQGVSVPQPAFVDVVTLRFGIADAAAHYHVPLLVTPWAYSTYRGS